MFDSVAGLPLHPLVVHLAVVALPLSAVALIAVVLRSAWRRNYALPAVAGLVVGMVASFIAKESGEALAQQVGDPGRHAEYGDWLVPLAFVTAGLAAGWWWVQRREDTPLSRVLGYACAALSLATLVLTGLVGHSGAAVVWSDVTPVAAPSSQTETRYALADVAKHATKEDCWAAVDGTVYNLTSWIQQHPGGPDRIIALCGTDATSAFTNQHDGQSQPAARLAGFKVGVLGQ